MLKLLFLARSGADPAPLLMPQRERFESLAERLTAAIDEPTGSIRCCCGGAWSRRPRRSGSSTVC
jgi:hypothetical protein